MAYAIQLSLFDEKESDCLFRAIAEVDQSKEKMRRSLFASIEDLRKDLHHVKQENLHLKRLMYSQLNIPLDAMELHVEEKKKRVKKIETPNFPGL